MVHPKLNENCRGASLRLRRFKRLRQLLISIKGIRTVLLGCFILGALAIPHPAVSQILELEKEGFLEQDAQLPWVLEADELTYDQQLNQYNARGNVQIYKANKKLTADFVRYNDKTRRAFAQGNVVLTVGQDRLTGSQLDIEARKRGNRCYFPDRVVPMLPEALSNGLCSLKPQVDRLAMVCEMELDQAGNLGSALQGF